MDMYTMMITSDGVGRSGTFVLIDMVLNRMTKVRSCHNRHLCYNQFDHDDNADPNDNLLYKGSKEIDIAATLEHIRDQRSGNDCHDDYDHERWLMTIGAGMTIGDIYA